MVLAAGLGTRMRPITDHLPKPLVMVGGRTMLDRGLDKLQEAGVERAIVNVHHLADQIEDHVATRADPAIIISDERAELLDSAGGIVKALPLIGLSPFYILNADTFWIDEGEKNLIRLANFWDGERMDILVMLAELSDTTGHNGKVDFVLDEAGRSARAMGSVLGKVYAGAAILHPRILQAASATPHSLNHYFDLAIAQGRLFGMVMNGHWLTVGTPDAIAPAEHAIETYQPLSR